MKCMKQYLDSVTLVLCVLRISVGEACADSCDSSFSRSPRTAHDRKKGNLNSSESWVITPKAHCNWWRIEKWRCNTEDWWRLRILIENHTLNGLTWSHNWPVTGCLSRRDSSDVVEKGKVVGRWRAQFLQDRQLPYCRNTNFRKLPQGVLPRKKLCCESVSIFKDGLQLRKSSPTIKYVKISQNSNIKTSELKQIYNIIYIYNIYCI